MAWHAPLPLTWALASEYRGTPDGHRAKPQAVAPEARLGPPAIAGWAGRSGRRLLCPQSLVRAGRRWRESQPLLRAPTEISNRPNTRSSLAVLEGIFQHARSYLAHRWGCPDFVEGRKRQVTTGRCCKAS